MAGAEEHEGEQAQSGRAVLGVAEHVTAGGVAGNVRVAGLGERDLAERERVAAREPERVAQQIRTWMRDS